MSGRPRKSSACVTLVLIGAAALSGCGDSSNSNRRATYATKEECLADWGDPKDCEQRETITSGGARSHYWGPSASTYHNWGSSSRSGSWWSGNSSSGSSGHSISRGGFGSHGSSSS